MISARCFLALCLLALPSPVPAVDDAVAIVRRSVRADDQGERLRRNYTYNVLNRLTELDSKGKPTKVTSKLDEVLYIGGRRHLRLIAEDGKPLPPPAEKREQQKLDRAVAEASKLSPEERRRREDETARGNAKSREGFRRIPDAFTFSLEREVVIAGRPAWQIHAKPRPEYRGELDSLFHHIEGTLWIDKADYAWVKVDATTLDTVSIGLFLMRLAPGSRVLLESIKVNDEVWVRKHITVQASARIALLKKLNVDQELVFSDYRKFQSDSRVVSTEEEK